MNIWIMFLLSKIYSFSLRRIPLRCNLQRPIMNVPNVSDDIWDDGEISWKDILISE